MTTTYEYQNGRLMQVPESLKAVAMYYNKDKVATPPATTDELLAAVQGGLKLGLLQGIYHNFGFAGAFGTRHADATEHQDGLTLAVALESLVKLLAFLTVGGFVVGWMLRDLPAASSAVHGVGALAGQTSGPATLIVQTLLSAVIPAAILIAIAVMKKKVSKEEAWMQGVYWLSFPLGAALAAYCFRV